MRKITRGSRRFPIPCYAKSVTRRWVMAALFVAGCGFRTLDGDPPTPDLATADASRGSDLATALPDLAVPDLDARGGPGPLGALPAGFCCSSDEECRSRACLSSGGGPRFCSDECRSDPVCSAWGAAFVCDLSSGLCKPSGTPYTCLP